MPGTVSRRTRRRFVLGCQGLWPGRRAVGLEGTRRALRLAEGVQVDPLSVVARSHDLVLQSRVIDYQPEYLDTLLYQKREFFDYGGWLCIRPMDELPYLRLAMEKVRHSDRWRSYEDEHQAVLSFVRGHLRDGGPLAARDLPGQGKPGSFRSAKETSVALYYLWLTGEVMTYGRHRNFERLYALRSQVAPPAYDYVATEAETTDYYVSKASRWSGLATAPTWAARLGAGRVVGKERTKLLSELMSSGVLTEVQVEGDRPAHYLPTERVSWLEQVEAGEIPTAWQPAGPDTTQEAVLLSPLDLVMRVPRNVFDFELVFEAYKPAAKRRWGYYTMPVLWGDQFVARVDPKLDRETQTLDIAGLWLEDGSSASDGVLVAALAAGIARLASDVGATHVEFGAGVPTRLRSRLRAGTP